MSNKYTYSVPFTEDQLRRAYVDEGKSQTEIAREFGTTQKVVWRAMQKLGISTRRAIPRDQRLESNPNWRGGRTLQPATGKRPPFLDRGYWQVYRPGHSHALKNGYVYEHIIVALEAAGMDHLPEGHCVHHINLRKDDNRPENLVILDHKTHQGFHNQLEVLAIRLLLDTGKIRFSADAGYLEVEGT